MSLGGPCEAADVEPELDLGLPVAEPTRSRTDDRPPDLRVVENEVEPPRAIICCRTDNVVSHDPARPEEGLHGRENQPVGASPDEVDLVAMGLHLVVCELAGAKAHRELRPGRRNQPFGLQRKRDE